MIDNSYLFWAVTAIVGIIALAATIAGKYQTQANRARTRR